MKSKIYSLIDPITLKVRYIGVTKNSSNKRLNGHLTEKSTTHKYYWIKKLKEAGLVPIFNIIEEVPHDQRYDREKYWISVMRSMGCDLVNSTDGGEGILNPSEETKEKISLWHRNKKLSPEHKAKIGLSKKGNHFNLGIKRGPITAIRSEKLSKALMGNKYALGHRPWLGKKHSKETIEKMSILKIGKKQNEETLNKKREAMKRYASTPEAKEKLSFAAQCRVYKSHTEETKQKIRLANTGKKASLATREKMRASHHVMIFTDEIREKIRMSKLGEKLSPEHIQAIKDGRANKKRIRQESKRFLCQRFSVQTIMNEELRLGKAVIPTTDGSAN